MKPTHYEHTNFFHVSLSVLCTFSSQNLKDTSFHFNSIRKPTAFQLIQYVKQHESSLQRETANY
jgi:hypothetical protein